MCGSQFTNVLPPDDVRICNGQLNEMFNDGGGIPINSIMIRQPFDFTGRAGTVVFDVDAKRNDGWDGHGWWLEFWVTEDPAPIPYHGAPTVASHPRNGIGLQIAPTGDAFDTDPQVRQLNSLSRLVVSRNFLLVRDQALDPEVTYRVKDTRLNKFKIVLSKDMIEVWASDFDSDERKLLMTQSGLDLSFETGYVHFQHVHYNASKTANCGCDHDEFMACKAGGGGLCANDCRVDCSQYPNGFFASSTQAYRWDNLAFDGPAHPLVRAYDVADSLRDISFEDDGQQISRVELGYSVPIGGETFTVQGVDLAGARRATFNWNNEANTGEVVRYRFNGKAWRDFVIPEYDEGGWLLRAHTIEVPLDELVQGTNTIEMTGDDVRSANLDLTIHTSGGGVE
jgi:hypothetical protein